MGTYCLTTGDPGHCLQARLRILYYESQRGCPFQCAYCLSSIDKKVRLRDIETVTSELQYFLDNRVPQVKFIDRTFNCNEKHALSICSYLSENDNGVTNFHFEIAADLLTEGQLAVLRGMRPGLIQLEIGVQSTNDTTLGTINRRMVLPLSGAVGFCMFRSRGQACPFYRAAYLRPVPARKPKEPP